MVMARSGRVELSQLPSKEDLQQWFKTLSARYFDENDSQLHACSDIDWSGALKR